MCSVFKTLLSHHLEPGLKQLVGFSGSVGSRGVEQQGSPQRTFLYLMVNGDLQNKLLGSVLLLEGKPGVNIIS